MPTTRTEPARAAEDKSNGRAGQAAPAEAPAAAPAPSSGGWKAWLPLVLALVLMPALAYGVTSFVLIPKMQKALTGAGVASVESGKDAPKESAPSEKEGAAPARQRQNATLNKLLVNVAGTMGSRYLLTSLTLTGKAADLQAKVTQNEPQLRDLACGLLSAKTIVDLEKPGARNIIRGELLAGFNNILGNGAVQEIYFTEFSIQ